MRPRLLEIPDAQLLAMLAAVAVLLYGAYRAAMASRVSSGRAAGAMVIAAAIAFALVKFVALNPDFEGQGIPIYAYGFFIMLAFASAILLSAERGREMALDPNKMMDLGLYAMVGGIAGSRIWHYLQYRDQYQDFFQIVQIWRGGIVYYGGLIGAFLTCSWFMIRHKLSYWLAAEAVAPTLALGLAFARLGCFLNGCCFGARAGAHAFCAVTFPGNSPAFLDQRKLPDFPKEQAVAWPVYPTQLYESVGAILLFLGLLAYSNRVAKRPGETFFLFLVGYAPLRYIVETYRADTPANWFGPLHLTAGQATGIPLLLIGIVGLIAARAGRLPGQGTRTLAECRTGEVAPPAAGAAPAVANG